MPTLPHAPQIPAGLLADRLGGAHLAAWGLCLWSLACALVSLVPSSGSPFVALLAARAALGLAQSGLMPAMSALAGGWMDGRGWAGRGAWAGRQAAFLPVHPPGQPPLHPSACLSSISPSLFSPLVPRLPALADDQPGVRLLFVGQRGGVGAHAAGGRGERGSAA